MKTANILELAAILRALREHYAQYIVLADQQRKAVVENRLNDIQDVNAHIDQIVFSIEDLEKERMHLMELVSQDAGQEISRLSDLLQIDPSQECELLVQEANDLRDLLAQVRSKNEVNQRLIKSSREYVRSTIAIVTGYISPKPQNQFNTYGRTGRMYAPKAQEVRLFNGSL